MIKHALVATLLFTTAAHADTRINGQVRDHFTTVYENVEVVDRRCEMVDVPIYGTRQQQGDAAGSALLGMIIGGIVGDAVSGGDGGATAGGAVIGGMIGADQGSRPRPQQVITGYRQERVCTDAVHYEQQPKNVYSHSTLRFTLDGKTYTIDFIK
jgi:uncharacterized protein YcfJ